MFLLSYFFEINYSSIVALVVHANCLVDYIDKPITEYKEHWLEEL